MFISATIDYILETTGAEQVYFIGYSMATTQYLILLAEVPEYNEQIKAGFLLGPTAYVGNATNPMVKLADQAELVQSAFQLVGMDEFMPNFLDVKSKIFHKTCRASYMHKLMCRNLFGRYIALTFPVHPYNRIFYLQKNRTAGWFRAIRH